MATYKPKIKLDAAGNTEEIQLPVSVVNGLSDTLGAKANSADLAKVATSGSYADLSNKPTIPTVNNGTLTIQKNGTVVTTFSANQSGNATANITVPTKVSELTNDSSYATTSAVNAKYTKPSGGIPKSDLASAVQTSLGKADTALQSHQSLANYVTKTGGTSDSPETISGVKTFSANNNFTGETKFTNEGYAPTFTDIASGLGKSSCFTRGALMQTITGQIIAPNAAVSDTTHAYNTEVGKIKFQRITGTSNGQPTLADMASIDSTGIKEGSTYLSAKYQSKLSDTQLNAVNSGITSTKVSTYDGYASTISAKLPTSNVSGTSGTLPKFTGTNSIGNSSVTQSSANDITVGGKLIVKSSGSTSGNSYNEGIRVLPASNGWSELFFSNDQTTSGNHEKGWILGKRGAAGATSGAAGDFTIECNGSSGNGLTLYADGSKPRWKNNELAYKSEIPTNYVTTDTEQTDISGAKGFVDDVTFNKDVLFQTGEQTEILKIDTTADEEAIEIFQQVVVGETAGTRGQVLTSQGAGNSPKWTTPSDLVQIRVSSVRRFRNTTDSTQPPATYNINVQIEGGLSNLQAGDKIQLCYPKKCKHKTRERFRYKSYDDYQITEYDIAMGYSSFSIPLEIYRRFEEEKGWEVVPPYCYSFTADINHKQPWIVRVQRNPIDPVNWIEDNACETVSNICKIIIEHDGSQFNKLVTIRPV